MKKTVCIWSALLLIALLPGIVAAEDGDRAWADAFQREWTHAERFAFTFSEQLDNAKGWLSDHTLLLLSANPESGRLTVSVSYPAGEGTPENEQLRAYSKEALVLALQVKQPALSDQDAQGIAACLDELESAAILGPEHTLHDFAGSVFVVAEYSPDKQNIIISLIDAPEG